MSPLNALASPGLRDVLGHVPPWYERWGTTLVAGMMAGLLALAGLVQYPDVLAVPVTVAAAQRVLLRLPGYPAGQPGTVAALSPGPAAGYYQLIIKLPPNWQPRPGPSGTVLPLPGTARIITRNTSLLERIFGPMRRLLAARF